MSIFNSNDYKRGYNNGYQDGFKNKEKNYFKSGLSIKFAIYGDHAIDSYNQGYNAGYEKGCEDSLSKKIPQKIYIETDQFHDIKTNKNFITMSSVQQYSLQQDKLQELVQFLNSFNYDMQMKLNEYKQRLQYMYESGLPEETKLRFEREHISETERLVNAISQLIDEQSIPFTNQNIALMENLIALNS